MDSLVEGGEAGGDAAFFGVGGVAVAATAAAEAKGVAAAVVVGMVVGEDALEGKDNGGGVDTAVDEAVMLVVCV